jgi:hypothetical protein
MKENRPGFKDVWAECVWADVEYKSKKNDWATWEDWANVRV